MGGGGESACTGGYKGVRAVRPESVAGRGWLEVLWNLECPVGLSQREICEHFNEGNLAQFRRSAETFKLVELRSEILISRPKVAQIPLVVIDGNFSA